MRRDPPGDGVRQEVGEDGSEGAARPALPGLWSYLQIKTVRNPRQSPFFLLALSLVSYRPLAALASRPLIEALCACAKTGTGSI